MGNPHDNEEEREHFQRIVCAFKYYRTHSLQRVVKTENYLMTLPERHQQLLQDYRQHLTNIRSCIENNDYIIKLIIKDVAYMFENVHPAGPMEPTKIVSPRPGWPDLEKVQATLKQFVRDWSDEGEEERQACYQPIIDEIISNFPTDLCYSGDTSDNEPEFLAKTGSER